MAEIHISSTELDGDGIGREMSGDPMRVNRVSTMSVKRALVSGELTDVAFRKGKVRGGDEPSLESRRWDREVSLSDSRCRIDLVKRRRDRLHAARVRHGT